MPVLKAIIFDLGKVVFDLSFDRVFQYWANASNKSFDEVRDRFVFDEVFDQFEKGEIAPEQFRAIVSQRLDLQLTDADFDSGWCDLYLDKYPDIENLLLRLKEKYQLVALTNTNAIHNNTWREKYADTLLQFEKIFASHELATRKPEPEIFETVLDHLNLKPEDALFLDDNIDNINAARKMGMPAILVISFEQMKVELEAII